MLFPAWRAADEEKVCYRNCSRDGKQSKTRAAVLAAACWFFVKGTPRKVWAASHPGGGLIIYLQRLKRPSSESPWSERSVPQAAERRQRNVEDLVKKKKKKHRMLKEGAQQPESHTHQQICMSAASRGAAADVQHFVTCDQQQ